MKNKNKITASIITTLLLAGCGAENTVNVVEEPLPPIIGQFVDAPVSGLGYRINRAASGITDAITGVTDSNGNFEYFRGDSITFFIGDIEFPATSGGNFITPLQVFGTDTVFNQRVVNTVRLLQTLDSDGDPSNGITISPEAANVATMNLTGEESNDDFFNRSDEAFAAELATWLPNAGTINTTIVNKSTAIERFVNYIDDKLNVTQPNAFDPLKFSGTVNRAFSSSAGILSEAFVFTPTDENEATSGQYSQLDGETVIASGHYEFSFGNRHLTLTQTVENQNDIITRFTGRSYNTETDVYGLCITNGTTSLAEDAKSCDDNENAANNSFVMNSDKLAAELVRLAELPAEETRELVEEFATNKDSFYTSGYKKVRGGDTPLYFKTGGTPVLENNEIAINSARFSIGNNDPSKITSGSDTIASIDSGHQFNLSEGFTISFDVVSHGGGDAGAGSLSLYADNNTSSESNSVHGASSKFLSLSISNANFIAGTSFSYTYDPSEVAAAKELDPEVRVLSPFVKNSFLQIRTDSAGVISIDNLVIDTVAGFGIPNDTENAPEPEPEPEPEPQPDIIPNVFLPFSADYTLTDTASLFTAEYQSTAGKAGISGTDIPMYDRTGGTVTVTASGIELDGGRFTLGNTTPEIETADTDMTGTGIFDLSRPYNVVLDIVAIGGTETKEFQVYVDNNTSGSSKSIHSGASKFYSEEINTLTPGTTLKIPGLLATKNSFLQIRTETDGIVEFNNLHIEYVNENVILEEDFTGSTAETFFTAEYKSLATNTIAPLYNVTGGGSDMVFTNDQLTLSGSRFTIGEASPGTDTADGVLPQGTLDLSRPYNVLVDIVAIDSTSTLTKDFQIYVDNNTSSSAKSHLGGDSKFFSSDLADLVIGQTLTVKGLLATGSSFLQIRTEGGAIVTIDNVRIEYLDNKKIHSDDFETTTEAFFTAEYMALPEDATLPLYKSTGGSVIVVDGQLQLDSGRFSIGNTTPEVETTDVDLITTGVFDLSQPYNIVFDLISAEEPTDDKGNSLQIYVDNNTSSSSKSIHGGSSKFSSIKIAELTPGKVTIEGFIASESSFLQLRTESGGIVTIDNLTIEYLEDPTDTSFSCAKATSLYFCDDFTSGNLNNWEILASTDGSTAVGEFDILTLNDGNNVMRYTAGGAGGELILATDVAMANVPDSGNYFVEATIRPRQNSTTANKQFYLLGRYNSVGNWFGGGLNLQNSSSSSQVEVAISTDASIARPVQQKSPLLLGEKDGTDDGVWYTTRFEMIDGDLTVYLNGEKMGSTNDVTYTAKGVVGLFTNNRSFELDNLKVGDPSVKPIQLTLDYKEPSWDTTTTTDPLVINVSAFQNDGETADTFTVTSSNLGVVAATIDDTVITLTPTGEGEATITFVSGSDANIIRIIKVTVASGFTMPTTEYGSLNGKVIPEVSSTGQYVDTNLSITFDTDITLGSLGEVRIYKSSDDSLVDLLKVDNKKGANIDVLSALDKTRALNYTPLSIDEDGKTLNIDPRNDVLAFGESYYVVISSDVVIGAQLNSIDFDGIGKNSDWIFTTKFTAPSGNQILVDDNGNADFRTVQGALTYVMNNIAKDDAATISIKDGIYNEMLFLRNQHNITLQGESRENTIVQYDNYETFNGGSSGRPLFLVESADMLVLNNFTLKNSHIRDNAYSNQAEAIYFNSDYRLVANNMNFISEQDTILVKGYAWFYNSLVAGNVDFIWGYPAAALFEESEIRTVGDSKNGVTQTPVSGGYILQSRTPVATDPGFIFLNGEFTHGPGPIGNTVADGSTYFARSSGKSDAFDNMVLINNKIDTHIATVGWAVQGVNSQPAPNPENPTATGGWREYGSMDMSGNPLDISARVGGYELSSSEAADFLTRAAVFAGYNNGAGWDPQPLALPTLPDEPNNATNEPTATVNFGFAGYNFDITGGVGGNVVTVNNGADLKSALADAKAANTPVTIYVDGTITDTNSGGLGDPIDIKDMDNVSIVGVADRGVFNGIGISIRRANNIIIQNLKIHEVLTKGKDGISIEGDDDGSTTSNIWIDHNELYSSLAVDKEFYDGLLDSKAGAENITISYNYLHDSWKTSLHGHTENDTSSNTNRRITFHHNRFENIESRVPLFRFGEGHIYNNYYNNIRSTAINSRSGATLHIENNYFENTQNPIVSFYADSLGYWNVSGNFFGDNVTWTTPDPEDTNAQDGSSTTSYVAPYDYVLDDVEKVKSNVIANAGVGKLDQSDLTIPAVTDTSPSEAPVQAAIGLPFNENFSAANAEAFFTNSYRDISGSAGTNTPLFYRVTGSVELTSGELTITGARVSIGNTTPSVSTTTGDTSTTGVLDLTNNYQVSFKVVDISGNTDKSFQIYVDNNTSGSSNSIHGGASKFYSVALKDHIPGQTYVVDGIVASSSSFITIRSESEATITIDDFKIE
ncbi:MAG: pectinesterase family protein [Thalassotalea sp.]